MRRFVRTFFETILEVESELSGEWVATGTRSNNIDTQINAFANSNAGVRIIDVKNSESVYPHTTDASQRHHNLTYAVIYEAEREAVDYEPEQVVPLHAGASAPTIEAYATEGGVKKKFQIMCGVFPGREGFKLHPGDAQIAPAPVFSPDFDLNQLNKHFGNLKKD